MNKQEYIEQLREALNVVQAYESPELYPAWDDYCDDFGETPFETIEKAATALLELVKDGGFLPIEDANKIKDEEVCLIKKVNDRVHWISNGYWDGVTWTDGQSYLDGATHYRELNIEDTIMRIVGGV